MGVDRWDALTLLALAMIGVGLGMWQPWVGLATSGALLLALSVVGAWSTERIAKLEELAKLKRGG